MPHPMKHMKIVKSDMPLTTEEALSSAKAEFPHGLRVMLEPEVLKKLDMPKLPEVGQVMGLHAVVEVVSVSSDRAQNGGRDFRVDLQITDMALQDKSSNMEDPGKPMEEKPQDDTLLA